MSKSALVLLVSVVVMLNLNRSKANIATFTGSVTCCGIPLGGATVTMTGCLPPDHTGTLSSATIPDGTYSINHPEYCSESANSPCLLTLTPPAGSKCGPASLSTVAPQDAMEAQLNVSCQGPPAGPYPTPSSTPIPLGIDYDFPLTAMTGACYAPPPSPAVVPVPVVPVPVPAPVPETPSTCEPRPKPCKRTCPAAPCDSEFQKHFAVEKGSSPNTAMLTYTNFIRKWNCEPISWVTLQTDDCSSSGTCLKTENVMYGDQIKMEVKCGAAIQVWTHDGQFCESGNGDGGYGGNDGSHGSGHGGSDGSHGGDDGSHGSGHNGSNGSHGDDDGSHGSGHGNSDGSHGDGDGSHGSGHGGSDGSHGGDGEGEHSGSGDDGHKDDGHNGGEHDDNKSGDDGSHRSLLGPSLYTSLLGSTDKGSDKGNDKGSDKSADDKSKDGSWVSGSKDDSDKSKSGKDSNGGDKPGDKDGSHAHGDKDGSHGGKDGGSGTCMPDKYSDSSYLKAAAPFSKQGCGSSSGCICGPYISYKVKCSGGTRKLLRI